MRCQTSDALGVGSDSSGGWHGLEMVPSQRQLRTTRSSGAGGVASFLPGLSSGLLVSPVCLSHLPAPYPYPAPRCYSLLLNHRWEGPG